MYLVSKTIPHLEQLINEITPFYLVINLKERNMDAVIKKTT